MVRKSLLLAVLFLLLILQTGNAQVKQIEEREQAWIGYFSQIRLTGKSGIWIDLHLRLTDQFIQEPGLSILRTGYTYYLSDQARLTAGYAYVTQYSTTVEDIPEHRPWQQIQWLDKKPRFSMSQYLRLEERYRRKTVDGLLVDGYNFNYRFRYNMSLTIPLKGKQMAAKVPFLAIGDELFINAGKSIVNNYFDQNRFSLALGYQFTSHLNAQLGYMHVFQQSATANQFVRIDAIRVVVVQNLDLRAKE